MESSAFIPVKGFVSTPVKTFHALKGNESEGKHDGGSKPQRQWGIQVASRTLQPPSFEDPSNNLCLLTPGEELPATPAMFSKALLAPFFYKGERERKTPGAMHAIRWIAWINIELGHCRVY